MSRSSRHSDQKPPNAFPHEDTPQPTSSATANERGHAARPGQHSAKSPIQLIQPSPRTIPVQEIFQLLWACVTSPDYISDNNVSDASDRIVATTSTAALEVLQDHALFHLKAFASIYDITDKQLVLRRCSSQHPATKVPPDAGQAEYTSRELLFAIQDLENFVSSPPDGRRSKAKDSIVTDPQSSGHKEAVSRLASAWVARDRYAPLQSTLLTRTGPSIEPAQLSAISNPPSEDMTVQASWGGLCYTRTSADSDPHGDGDAWEIISGQPASTTGHIDPATRNITTTTFYYASSQDDEECISPLDLNSLDPYHGEHWCQVLLPCDLEGINRKWWRRAARCTVQ